MLTHMSLFSGICGIDMAAEWAGFETVGQCEFADYPTKVLEKHWPNVPRWMDVMDVTIESFRERTGIEKLTLLSGGFPCQPHSLAGKCLGSDDERDLWGEFNRLIGEIRPEWVLAENVPGLLSTDDGRFFGRILRDFSENGYNAWWISIPLSAIGGVFEGERVFIVGKAYNESKLQTYKTSVSVGSKWNSRKNIARSDRGDVSGTYWETHKSPVCGVDDGIKQRFYKDRMMALGNMVVPQHVYPILKAISDIESL